MSRSLPAVDTEEFADRPLFNRLSYATVTRLPCSCLAIQLEGRSAFHHAAACGHTQIVKMILDNQLSPVNQTDGGGKTALHLAAAGGHMQCTQVLISLGADVNQRERLNLNSPLHEAAYNGFSMTVDILCRAGSDANATNRQQSTPLHLSAQAGHNQCARVLLCGGSNPALPNTYGDSPLHTACRYGHAGVSRILLSAHPLTPVNMRNKNGDTALHIAAALRRKKIIKLLLECGAELHHKNQQGETPVDVAKRKGHTDVVDLLWQPATFPGGLMLSAAGSISTLPKVAAAGSGAVGHYAVSAVDPASQQQQQQQQLTAAAAPNLKLRQQPALLMNQPVLEAPQQQQQQQQHYHVPLQLHQQQQQQQQQHQQHQHQNQRFEISPASSSEPKEGTPKLEDQHTQQQQQQQHKKKRKFSLFKLFRKKSKERSIDPSATYANGGLTDVGPSSTTEAAPVPAVAASYHQHLGNGGQLLRPQVTSQCTCHVRVTSAASAAADQSRISHCILHGHREWHGVDSSTRTKITFGPPTAAARSTPPAEGATAAVHESLSYQQLFPISNPYHTSPIAGTGAAGDQQPRLYRTRSDESLSMSEFKVKTQKEKLRAYHDRQETWRAAAASAGAPQTGRRGAYQQQQQQQQSPGPQPAYSKPTAPPLSAGRPSGLTVQLVASQSPLQFRASPDGAQQQPQHQHLHHHHHHHLQFQHPQHHQQVEGEQTSLPAPVPPRRFDAGAPTGGGGAVNFGVRWQRSATPDSEIRARNRQAAEKLQQFRSVYNRGAAGAPAAATAAAAAAAAAGSAAVPSAGIASQSPQLPRNLQTNKSGALMTTHV